MCVTSMSTEGSQLQMLPSMSWKGNGNEAGRSWSQYAHPYHPSLWVYFTLTVMLEERLNDLEKLADMPAELDSTKGTTCLKTIIKAEVVNDEASNLSKCGCSILNFM